MFLTLRDVSTPSIALALCLQRQKPPQWFIPLTPYPPPFRSDETRVGTRQAVSSCRIADSLRSVVFRRFHGQCRAERAQEGIGFTGSPSSSSAFPARWPLSRRVTPPAGRAKNSQRFFTDRKRPRFSFPPLLPLWHTRLPFRALSVSFRSPSPRVLLVPALTDGVLAKTVAVDSLVLASFPRRDESVLLLDQERALSLALRRRRVFHGRILGRQPRACQRVPLDVVSRLPPRACSGRRVSDAFLPFTSVRLTGRCRTFGADYRDCRVRYAFRCT